MILGFAHLTVHTLDVDTTLADLAAGGWRPDESYRDIPSAPEKWPLLAKPANRHDLVLLRGPMALEVVAHDTGAVDCPSRLVLDYAEPDIQLFTHEVGPEKSFLVEGLGFTEMESNRLTLKSRFPQWNVSLSLSPSASPAVDPPLDLEGPSCLAFYSTNPQSDARRLQSHGGRGCTAPFEIGLGGRRMSVLMLRSPSGVILELIKINKGKSL